MENNDIRFMVLARGFTYKQVAKEVGISPVHISRLLRYPLSQENKERILKAIYKLDEERKGQQNETVARVTLPKLSKGQRQKNS